MSAENTENSSLATYQELLDQLKDGGDRAAAVRALTARAHDRLRRLVAKIMNESFPAVARGHEVDSVVSETYIRLAKALESVSPATPADFFRFAAHKVRQTLLNIVGKDQRVEEPVGTGHGSGDDSSGPPEPGSTTWSPDKLGEFTDFMNKIAALPEEVKDVFDLAYFLGLSQAEIADATGTHPRQVSRLMAKAAIALRDHLPD